MSEMMGMLKTIVRERNCGRCWAVLGNQYFVSAERGDLRFCQDCAKVLQAAGDSVGEIIDDPVRGAACEVVEMPGEEIADALVKQVSERIGTVNVAESLSWNQAQSEAMKRLMKKGCVTMTYPAVSDPAEESESIIIDRKQS